MHRTIIFLLQALLLVMAVIGGPATEETTKQKLPQTTTDPILSCDDKRATSYQRIPICVFEHPGKFLQDFNFFFLFRDRCSS
uniref:Secreted protein n=1 Tax=Oryza brachyantha TaxID=4533 RepID=J3N9P3_ORYBR